MIRKFVTGFCVLAFVTVFVLPARADQSIAFQKYFRQGLNAFNRHDEQRALYCFKLAEIYDPHNQILERYIAFLEKKGVRLAVSFSKPGEKSIGYLYYLKEGKRAFDFHRDKLAERYFKIALIFYPDSKEAQEYLQLIGERPPEFHGPLGTPEQIMPMPPPAHEVTLLPVPPVNVGQPPITAVQPAAALPRPSFITVMPSNPQQPPVLLSLAQITHNGQIKPKLQIYFHTSVIVEGRNIQRFLITDEGFIQVERLDADRLQIDGLRIGTTFIHIWDDFGLHTIYIEVVFPPSVTAASLEAMNMVRHSQPFVVTYANDWDQYYLGKDASQLKRQSYNFEQSLGLTGETPYGFLDASGDYQDFNSFTQFDTYTIGLSHIPMPGTDDLSLRGFDAYRYLSPLSMPGTRLRGAFADVDLMHNLVGISVSEGKEELPPGFYSSAELSSPYTDAYIDAAQITLFPKSNNDQYAFNFATAYGPDRSLQPYLANHVYSVEAMHRLNDFLTFNAEEGNDSSHNSQLASLKWQQGTFMSSLNFRNIDKDYSTISTLPADQGETGADWVTEGDFKNYTINSFVEAYQDHLYANPDDSNAFNYDGNAHLRADLSKNVWSDTDINFIDTPGELSPMSNVDLNQRLSRSFPIWNSLKGTVFGGAGYQYSHADGSDISDYNKEDVIAGIQLPLTSHVSTFSNYEYDWLDQSSAGGESNPSIVEAGVEYQKQFNPRFSTTAQLYYRNELGVEGQDSILSGQESVILSGSFNYNPTQDMSIFADTDASRVISHVGNLPYDDFEVHVGLRLTFGGVTYWDPLGTVSGIVFKDRLGTGKFGPGDEGIPDVKIKVGDQTVITDKNGHYTIKIRAKGVAVMPVVDTIPGGFLFSTSQTLNVEIIQGRTLHADFGLITQTGIYGIIFVDKTGTGTPNDNDQFIGKVRVVLDGKIVQKSDPHGAFYFRNVPPGEHTITIDINSLAINMLPRVKLSNKINVAEGTNYLFNVPVQIKQAVGAEE